MRESIKTRTPRDVKNGTKCHQCKREATLMGWYYRGLTKKSFGKKWYQPMCAYHFMEAFFGIYALDCTKACRRRAQRRNACQLGEDDFRTYVSSGLIFGDETWCTRHRIVIPIHCVHCSREIVKKVMYVRKKNPCTCGRSRDSIPDKDYWDLSHEERESLCMSQGWRER